MIMLLEPQNKGPACRFNDADVFFALEYVAKERSVGRQRISQYLGIGEGSMRKLLSLLEEVDLITVKQTGVSIKTAGKDLLEALGMRSVDLTVPGFVMGDFQKGIVIRNVSEKVFNGIDQRNAGMRAGGDGCTTWRMDGDNLTMLPSWNMDENNPQIADRIRRHTGMTDGEVLIMGGGKTTHLAMMASAMAALELI